MSGLPQRLVDAFARDYEILKELGSGGMATVFLARDRRYDRQVAIKVMRPDFVETVGSERFLREIEVVAKLNHPKIPPLFESGEKDGFFYFVMPFVEGPSVGEKLEASPQLPVEEALQIAIDVCDALGHAHGRGLVHRDIKPENIMMSGDTALVMDFGIAREQGVGNLTQTGMQVGTPTYMSPEHLNGEHVDGRSDLYALGCVLYQMLTGSPPFTGPSAQSIVIRHLTDRAPPIRNVRPAVPPLVEAAVFRAMEKVAADRFQTAEAFKKELQKGLLDSQTGLHRSPGRLDAASRRRRARLFGAGALIASAAVIGWWFGQRTGPDLRGTPSVAVLALVDRSADGGNEHLGDGISEEIIHALSAVEGLRVSARTSTFVFKRRDALIGEIGRELNVRTVLEGSVLRVGDSLTIDSRLFDARSEQELWSGAFVTTVANLGATQASIASAVLETLGLPPPEGALGRLTLENSRSAAYETYLRARFKFAQRGPALSEALALFQEAIRLDPGYSPAYAGLADALSLLGLYAFSPPERVLPAAREAAETAIRLDSLDGDAYNARAFVEMTWDWDWEAARRDYERAIRLNPGNPAARHWFAILLLLTEPTVEPALEQAAIAMDLDPLAAAPKVVRAQALMTAGRGGEAIEELKAAMVSDPASAFFAKGYLSVVLSQDGQMDEAITVGEEVVDESRRHPLTLSSLGVLYARAGRPGDAEAILDELTARARREHVQALTQAHLLAALGRVDEAFEKLDEAFDNRETLFISLKTMPEFAPLASDPRFDELLRRGGLPPGRPR